MESSINVVVVIGAGPVGLAAAAHLIEKGATPFVLEKGSRIGESVVRWGHVRVFSPWKYNVDKAAVSLLERAGWRAPNPEKLPLGSEIVRDYLEPLAKVPELRSQIHLGANVLSVARLGFDKMKSDGRYEAPFQVLYEEAGEIKEVLASAVIDASGTYTEPNPLGANGLPAMGEESLQSHIFYGIPDVTGRDRARYAGKRIAVVGAGHSASTVLLGLGALAEDDPSMQIIWVVRRTKRFFGGEDHDELAARGKLGSEVRQLVEKGVINLISGFKISALVPTDSSIELRDGTRSLDPVDEIVSCTGFRPNFALASELRLSLDPTTESPQAIASMIDPNVHSCGSVPPHGANELKHPEQDFYVVGMKSYGRAPTFLMLTGYEQVRSVTCAITGDVTGAEAVQLQLPETGVCFTDVDEGERSCCDAAPPNKIDLRNRVSRSLPCLAPINPYSLWPRSPQKLNLAALNPLMGGLNVRIDLYASSTCGPEPRRSVRRVEHSDLQRLHLRLSRC